ncbi:MAG: SDR family oxidoreductase [Janthinobacterium lividum]
MGRLDNKVAVVTGAGRGIGAAIARAFAREGACVVLAERDIAAARATAAQIVAGLAVGASSADTAAPSAFAVDSPKRGSGDSPSSIDPDVARVLAVETDVTRVESVHAAIATARSAFGPIDILVNNAGINVFRDPLAMSEDDWRACFAVDLDGVWHGCRAVLPEMVARGRGSIVNIASTHSFKIIPGCFPYPVAKHGVIGLTRALGVEYAAHNIRVNAIAPGYIETQLAHDEWNRAADPAVARQATLALSPMKRIGQPEEVAMTAVFLASDEAPFINASCITVDGGRSALYHD